METVEDKGSSHSPSLAHYPQSQPHSSSQQHQSASDSFSSSDGALPGVSYPDDNDEFEGLT